VVELAIQGLANREIAGELVVTVKAVEWHLSNAYKKLGINSRSELADVLEARR
jgi:DNA-binding NarL/FixJ family response regulator